MKERKRQEGKGWMDRNKEVSRKKERTKEGRKEKGRKEGE